MEVGVLPGRLTSPLQGWSVWRSQRLRWTWAKDALSIEHSCNRFTDCGLSVCVHLLRYECETKGEDLFLFRIIFPSIYVPQKTNEGRRQLAKVIVIIWKPSSVFLVDDYDLDSPLKASRYRNKHILVSCDEEFPPDNLYRSIYPLRKMGLFFSGNAFYQVIKARPDLLNWSRVIVAHRECRKQTLK